MRPSRPPPQRKNKIIVAPPAETLTLLEATRGEMGPKGEEAPDPVSASDPRLREELRSSLPAVSGGVLLARASVRPHPQENSRAADPICRGRMQSGADKNRKNLVNHEFFTEYGEGNRYQIQEVIGRGSYGVVCSAIDTHSGEKVAIKKINDIFEHVSDATRILREIKLLRLLRHPDIVEIKHIMLPPSPREFKDIYVVFELMESDLHQVIKANDDLSPEHYQFFLYQLLRALKYIHTGANLHGIGFQNLLRKMFFVNTGFGAQMVSGVVDMEL